MEELRDRATAMVEHHSAKVCICPWCVCVCMRVRARHVCHVYIREMHAYTRASVLAAR
jgi:hypothetical protein